MRQHISNQASFDPRNYGFKAFGDLVEAIGLFEVRREGSTVLLRDKRGVRPARGARTE